MSTFLPCPVCLHTGVFESVQSLRDRLIFVSNSKLSCPICLEEITGLDKLTIHLFSHIKIINSECVTKKEVRTECIISGNKSKSKSESVTDVGLKQKMSKTLTKNKTIPSVSNAPVKFVKIFPKLPVISVNAMPIMEMPRNAMKESTEVTINTNTPSNIINEKQDLNTRCNEKLRTRVHNVIKRLHSNNLITSIYYIIMMRSLISVVTVDVLLKSCPHYTTIKGYTREKNHFLAKPVGNVSVNVFLILFIDEFIQVLCLINVLLVTKVFDIKCHKELTNARPSLLAQWCVSQEILSKN